MFTNNSSWENEMGFQSFECFSKSSIDVEITRPFQLIYLFISLKNISDHWLYIKPKIKISDQKKYVFVHGAVKVDYKENWISALTTVKNTLFLWILPHGIFEILNLHLRSWLFPPISSPIKERLEILTGFLVEISMPSILILIGSTIDNLLCSVCDCFNYLIRATCRSLAAKRAPWHWELHNTQLWFPSLWRGMRDSGSENKRK